MIVGVPYLNEVGVFSVTYSNNSMDLLYQFLFLIIVKVHIPLR